MNFMIDTVRIGHEGRRLWKMRIIFKSHRFFRLHQNVFFRCTCFNRLLAVCVRAIICFGSSSIALLVLKQQEFEVGSHLGINVPYCL